MAFIILYCFFISIASVAYGADGDYVIGEEDVLRISVWGNPEMTAELPVRPDGKISFYLIGDIKVAGKTSAEVKKLIETELSKYIKAPVVNVMVIAINSYKVYVIKQGGMISRDAERGVTGVIQLRKKTTLLQLLSQIGSLEDIDFRNSLIIRNGERLNVNLLSLINGDLTQDILLKPGDIVFLADNFHNRIKVIGAIRTPSILSYKEGLTVMDAILQCGGFTEFAKQNDVIIIRKEEDGVRRLAVRAGDILNKGELNQDIPLRPGDTIIVKTGIF